MSSRKLPIDIAIFLPSLHGGGAERVMLTLAGEFSSRGLRCEIVIAVTEGELLGSVPAGVSLVSFGRTQALNATLDLASYLRRTQPKVLMSTIFSANIVALLARSISLTSVRVVTREASPTNRDVRASSKQGTYFNAIAALALYPLADAAIAVAKTMIPALVRYNRGKPTTVAIPNPLSLKHEAIKTHTRSDANPVLVACGRLEPQKDYPTLLRAFARIRQENDAKLIILGEGSLRESLVAMTRELSIDQHVRFEGFVRSPETYMQTASVFVHTSRYEGFPSVILEALHCGCKVVAVDGQGGAKEALGNGVYGALVPEGDDQRIAAAVLDILAGRVGFPSASDYLKCFSVPTIADRYLDILLPDVRPVASEH